MGAFAIGTGTPGSIWVETLLLLKQVVVPTITLEGFKST